MTQTYTYPKRFLAKDEIGRIEVFFENGDRVWFSRREIIDFSVVLADELRRDDNRGFHQVAFSGGITLRFLPKKSRSTFDACGGGWNRPQAVLREFLENTIHSIGFYDKNEWCYILLGYFAVEEAEEGVSLSFLNPGNLTNEKDESSVSLHDVTLDAIDTVNLDFENCDGIEVYREEISECDLTFDTVLTDSGGDFVRRITDGVMRLKFDKLHNDYRKANLLRPGRRVTTRRLNDRICPRRKKKSDHDICHLYVKYEYGFFGPDREECIAIDDLDYPHRHPGEICLDPLLRDREAEGYNDPDEFIEFDEYLEDGEEDTDEPIDDDLEEDDEDFEEDDEISDENDEDEEYDDEYAKFVGGMCERCDDGSLLIRFGVCDEEFF